MFNNSRELASSRFSHTAIRAVVSRNTEQPPNPTDEQNTTPDNLKFSLTGKVVEVNGKSVETIRDSLSNDDAIPETSQEPKSFDPVSLFSPQQEKSRVREAIAQLSEETQGGALKKEFSSYMQELALQNTQPLNMQAPINPQAGFMGSGQVAPSASASASASASIVTVNSPSAIINDSPSIVIAPPSNGGAQQEINSNNNINTIIFVNPDEDY